MAKIRIVGDSSGYVELAAPNAAGNNTLELPSNATKLVGADASNSLNVTGIATFSGGIVGNVTGNATGLSGNPNISVSTIGVNGATAQTPIDAISNSSGNGITVRGRSADGLGNIRFTSNDYATLYGGLTHNATNLNLFNERAGSLILGSNGIDRVTIDSSGRVTKPYQPAFLAFFSSSSDATTNAGAVFAFDKVDFNVGGHFNTSTNRFTCPVAGIYAFSWAFFFTNSASNTQGMNVAFLVNGSQYSPSDGVTTSDALQMSTTPNSAGGYLSNSATYYIQLSANDYVQLYARGANVRLYQGHSHFSGILLA